MLKKILVAALLTMAAASTQTADAQIFVRGRGFGVGIGTPYYGAYNYSTPRYYTPSYNQFNTVTPSYTPYAISSPSYGSPGVVYQQNGYYNGNVRSNYYSPRYYNGGRYYR